MEIKRYIVYRNDKTNHPMLKEKEVYQWDLDFSSYQNIVKFLNQALEMNHLEEEYVYVMAFNWQSIPQGIFELSHGTSDTSLIGMRELAIFLLLSGANRFIVAHNHPNGSEKLSTEDAVITASIQKMANLINIDFLQHFVIGNEGYDTCIFVEDDDEIFERYNNPEDECDGEVLPFGLEGSGDDLPFDLN